jgi:hypothetical protein
MSRYAYPASSAREDVTFHGSAEADAEVKKLIAQELAESRMVGIVRIGGTCIPCIGYPKGQMLIAGPIPSHSVLSREVRVVTRSGHNSGNPPGASAPPPAAPLHPSRTTHSRFFIPDPVSPAATANLPHAEIPSGVDSSAGDSYGVVTRSRALRSRSAPPQLGTGSRESDAPLEAYPSLMTPLEAHPSREGPKHPCRTQDLHTPQSSLSRGVYAVGQPHYTVQCCPHPTIC